MRRKEHWKKDKNGIVWFCYEKSILGFPTDYFVLIWVFILFRFNPSPEFLWRGHYI